MYSATISLKLHTNSNRRQNRQHRRLAGFDLKGLAVDTVILGEDIFAVIDINDIEIKAPFPAEPLSIRRDAKVEAVIIRQSRLIEILITAAIDDKDHATPVFVDFSNIIPRKSIFLLDNTRLDTNGLRPREAGAESPREIHIEPGSCFPPTGDAEIVTPVKIKRNSEAISVSIRKFKRI